MDDELLVRSIPHSVEAEQAVIGSILIAPKCLPEVVEELKPDDFYIKENRDIYATIYSMFGLGDPVDAITVLNRMELNGVYDPEHSRNYIFQVVDITPTATHVMDYAAIVKDKALLRRVAQTAADITAAVSEGSSTGETMLELAEQRITGIREGSTVKGLVPAEVAVVEVLDRLSELSQNEGEVPGLSTGLPDLDRMISGLNKSDLILLAARPGMGKTSLALNILLHAGKFSGKDVVFFSLEMSREQLTMRLLSNESFVDNKKLVLGALNEDDWGKVALAASALTASRIYMDDNPSLTVADMNAKCRKVKDLGLVVIDYLQLMQSAGGKSHNGENRQQIVSDISRALKIMAKELNVPVLCLSQLSRANESRQDKRPMLSDLRESGAIEQDADIVMFIYREDYYKETAENHNRAECIVAKNRHGETGTVPLQWLPEFTTFSSLDTRHVE